MATIEFKEYIIEKSLYHSNPQFEASNEEGELVVEDNFSAEIGVNENQGYVIINISLGNFDDTEKIKNIPFSLEVTIRGIFNYSLDKEESRAQLKSLLGVNALAILYPYLRAYVTLITSQTNQFPPYILPVANFVEILYNDNKVEFFGFTDDNNQ